MPYHTRSADRTKALALWAGDCASALMIMGKVLYHLGLLCPLWTLVTVHQAIWCFFLSIQEDFYSVYIQIGKLVTQLTSYSHQFPSVHQQDVDLIVWGSHGPLTFDSSLWRPGKHKNVIRKWCEMIGNASMPLKSFSGDIYGDPQVNWFFTWYFVTWVCILNSLTIIFMMRISFSGETVSLHTTCVWTKTWRFLEQVPHAVPYAVPSTPGKSSNRVWISLLCEYREEDTARRCSKTYRWMLDGKDM